MMYPMYLMYLMYRGTWGLGEKEEDRSEEHDLQGSALDPLPDTGNQTAARQPDLCPWS